MVRLIIAGSRDLSVERLLKRQECPGWPAAALDLLLSRFLFRRIEQQIGWLALTGRVTEVVSGKAEGVDEYGERWAKERGIAVQPFPPQYAQFPGKEREAPLARNEQMAFYASADVQKGALVLITLDNSAGSRHMRAQAQREGLAIGHEDWSMAALLGELAGNTRYIGCPHPLVAQR